MTTKIKTALLTAFFIFGLLTGLQAQDEYHLARISLNYFVDNQIVIVSDNSPEKVVTLEKGTGTRDKIKALLQTVNQMTKEGWEIINVTEFNQVTTYFLKRK